MSYTKKKLYKNRKNFSKNRTKLHKFRKHKKRINSKKKHYKKNHKKITKKYKKIMKGGVAPFLSTSYTESDTPIAPPSAISYIPAPLMNLKWSMDSSAKNLLMNYSVNQDNIHLVQQINQLGIKKYHWKQYQLLPVK